MHTTTVSPGTRLGPYRIESLIGAGGMGEVYRARDERLQRSVAVKVLPPSLAADQDRLRRFELEARSAGQLNHPNILAIHDVGSENGLAYLVSELLEGHDLRHALAEGPIPPRKAVEIVIQVANGLAAAHAKGIAHRDLKPENVYVTTDGRVKILDFGLAKLTRPAETGAGASGSTAAAAGAAGANDETGAGLTMTGTILGTASYMSPEQIRMQPTDHRTDIFSLGCILYEILTGRRAFEGETAADRMSAILHSDPPELPRAVEDAIPGVDLVTRRCIEKRADDRFESARELAFALTLVTKRVGVGRDTEPDRASPVETAGAGAEPAATFPVTLHRVAYRDGFVRSARFAPDGQTICYTAAWEGRPMELFWALSGNPESRALGFPETEIFSIAPNGEMAVSLKRRHLGGFTYTGMLARMPLGGGAPRPVLDGVLEAAWSPDGRQLAITREVEGRVRLEYPAGKVLYETTGWPSHIRISPDGSRIAFIDHPHRANDAGSVTVVDREGNHRALASGGSSVQGVAWSPDGREIWFTALKDDAARSLWAVTLEGRLRPVFQAPGSLILHDISKSGDVLIVHGTERLRMQYQGPDDERPRDLSWLDWSLVREFFPDGRSILFDETGVGGGQGHSVYMRDVDGSPAIRLGDGYNPHLSPDGQWALANLDMPESMLHLIPTGAGETRAVSTGTLQWNAAWFFPDGKRLCVAASEGESALRLFELDLSTGAYRAFTEEGITPAGILVSEDGKTAGARGPSGKYTLYPVDGGTPQVLETIGRQEHPFAWAQDGKALLTYTRGTLPSVVSRVDLTTGEHTVVREITPADRTGVDGITHVVMTPDEKAVAFSYAQVLGDLYVIRGLR